MASLISTRGRCFRWDQHSRPGWPTFHPPFSIHYAFGNHAANFSLRNDVLRYQTTRTHGQPEIIEIRLAKCIEARTSLVLSDFFAAKNRGLPPGSRRQKKFALKVDENGIKREFIVHSRYAEFLSQVHTRMSVLKMHQRIDCPSSS